jgi:3-isopropylmalate/(R)-2-methylmalate dehydratase large subunit
VPVPKTLYEKLWESHVVHREADGTTLLYVDRHLLHEVSSPQAFAGLREAGRGVWRRDANLAMADHNVPTRGGPTIADPASRLQVETLLANCAAHGIPVFGMGDPRQGIVHVVGPELGAILPGMTVVCSDSHTSTHGALGALGIGVGTSEAELVLTAQCLLARRMQTMRVRCDGRLAPSVSAKDLGLAVIRRLGVGGGAGHAIEFTGAAVRALSMEGRMTLCNMAIEAGARSALIGVDDTTLRYLEGRPYAPTGADWARAVAAWRALRSDEGARFDVTVALDAGRVAPHVTWGTAPDLSVAIDESLPDPAAESDPHRARLFRRAYAYMGLTPGMPATAIPIDVVFIGSCTNGRLEDLRAAAAVARGRTRAPSVRRVLVVPGSRAVQRAAEAEGLDRLFCAAGFEWRQPGCSMCLGMNEDRLAPGERCASTSNRNFEGRQGAGGRTHLVSPAMAAAAAVTGHVVDVRTLGGVR